MDTSKNRLRLDFNDLPDLKAALGGLSPGDRCKVSFEIMVVKNDDNGLDGDIEGVEYETGADAEEGSEASTGEVEPTSEEPIIAVIAKRNASKKKPAKSSSSSDEETDAEE